ncbi:MAG: hypothetical protein AAF500_16395 [Myxococcota bacterium]
MESTGKTRRQIEYQMRPGGSLKPEWMDGRKFHAETFHLAVKTILRIHETQAGPNVSQVILDYERHKTEKAYIDARRAELELRVRIGELVEVRDVYYEAERSSVLTKTRILQVPGQRAGEWFRAAKTARELEILVDADYREALIDLGLQIQGEPASEEHYAEDQECKSIESTELKRESTDHDAVQIQGDRE